MYRLKTAGTDQVLLGPVPILMVVKIILTTAKLSDLLKKVSLI